MELRFGFVKFPPSPCKATKISGSITLQYPVDPNFPPDPVTVNLSGHLRDDHSAVLTGSVRAEAPFYPGDAMRVVVTPSFPPSPCVANTGTFASTITLA